MTKHRTEIFGFRKRLMEEMAKKNITDAQLAKRIGVHRTVIGNYVYGKTVPNSHTVVAIARALNLSTDFLLTGKESSYDQGYREGVEAALKAVQEVINK